ncbi:MAG: ABC transporter ATP-binding protein [Pseudomonadota bacterium]
MTEPLVSIRDVQVHFDSPLGRVHAVKGVDLDLFPGETLALVGESGAGKSAFAKSLLQLNEPPFTPRHTRVEGQMSLRLPFEADLINPTPAVLREVRAKAIGMVFQDSLSALNPVKRIGQQIAEALAKSGRVADGDIPAAVLEMVRAIGLPEPESTVDAYPHQLSGGQCQRVVIAMAAIRHPVALIADEPTTALDVTVQAQILRLLKDLCQTRQMAMLFISHDLGVVAEIADRVAVMRHGKIVELTTRGALFAKPRQAYTRTLLASRPGRRGVTPPLAHDTNDQAPVIVAQGVSYSYGAGLWGGGRGGLALDDVSLTVYPGESHGLVGESGSGKSTFGRVILGFLAPSLGHIQTCGRVPDDVRGDDRMEFRRDVQVIYQDSATALNPRMPLGRSAAEGLEIRGMPRVEALAKVGRLFDQVGLPRALLTRFPHEVSGGQRQRVCIARALALRPKLLIADEPVTALDVSVQAQILDLFRDLQAELSLAMVFISHDLDVVGELCSRVSVMHRGRIVEHGTAQQVLQDPSTSYAKSLVESIPGQATA